MGFARWSGGWVLVLTLLNPIVVHGWSAADRDFDGDGRIGFADYLQFAQAYGSDQEKYDLNGDGNVGFGDFIMFAPYYGRTVAETEIPDTTSVSLPTRDVGEVRMQFVYISPGTYMMGQLTQWPIGGMGENDAWPRHEVTISKGFYLGKYEVTQAQWEGVMGTTPWFGQTYSWSGLPSVLEADDAPAVYVSWKMAQTFISTLNQKTSGPGPFRLPTEAEWEYACRAGTTTNFSFGNDLQKLQNYGWYTVNTLPQGQNWAHRVGRLLRNPWGLYDMHGNVSEWCEDWFWPYSEAAQTDPAGSDKGTERVLRGGRYSQMEGFLYSWRRGHEVDNYEDPGVGLRLVMEVQ